MSLLSNCTSGGCGAKIGPGELSSILEKLPDFRDKDMMIGFDSSDDASVYRLNDTQAIISTVDFFTPMIDDPYIFGMIAATNAMSDVYAMGGDVLFALNLVCFPQKLPKTMLGEILAGGAEKIKEAGAILSGGHSIYDHEPKYGLAVTGIVAPDKVLRNSTAQVGDSLILTKPLGTGLVFSADRVNMAEAEHVQDAIDTMTRLNKYAAEKMKAFPVSACTDITGFGLLAHLLEMTANEKTFLIDTAELPLLSGAIHYAEEYFATAAGQRNRNHIGAEVDMAHLSPALQEVLFDPQTSGGLLISVPSEDAETLLLSIQTDDPAARIIGTVIPKEEQSIILV